MKTFVDQLTSKFPELRGMLDIIETRDGPFSSMPEGAGVMAVMGQAGDSKHIWDPSKEDEVEAARTLFNFFVAKGYTAWRVVGKEGEKGDKMVAFDGKAGMIIFTPRMVGG